MFLQKHCSSIREILILLSSIVDLFFFLKNIKLLVCDATNRR